MLSCSSSSSYLTFVDDEDKVLGLRRRASSIGKSLSFVAASGTDGKRRFIASVDLTFFVVFVVFLLSKISPSFLFDFKFNSAFVNSLIKKIKELVIKNNIIYIKLNLPFL